MLQDKKSLIILILIIGVVSFFFYFLFFKKSTIKIISPGKDYNTDTQKVKIITPTEEEKIYNPFLVKISYPTKPKEKELLVKLFDRKNRILASKILEEFGLYYIGYISFEPEEEIKQAILKIYEKDISTESEKLIKQQPLYFEDSSKGLTIDQLFNIKKAKARINFKEFLVEVANDLKSRTKGLSLREKMDENQGMLFVFEKPGFHSFWMKDMKFDLDIIWIFYDTIVYIEKNVKAPSLEGDTELKIYTPKERANLVLEVNSGISSKYNFKIGDKIKIENIK